MTPSPKTQRLERRGVSASCENQGLGAGNGGASSTDGAPPRDDSGAQRADAAVHWREGAIHCRHVRVARHGSSVPGEPHSARSRSSLPNAASLHAALASARGTAQPWRGLLVAFQRITPSRQPAVAGRKGAPAAPCGSSLAPPAHLLTLKCAAPGVTALLSGSSRLLPHDGRSAVAPWLPALPIFYLPSPFAPFRQPLHGPFPPAGSVGIPSGEFPNPAARDGGAPSILHPQA